MKIDNPKKFLEAMQHDQGMRDKIKTRQRLTVNKAFVIADKLKDVVGDNEEAKKMISELSDTLENLHDQLCHIQPFGSFRDCVWRIMMYEVTSTIRHEEYPECPASEYHLRGDFTEYGMTFSEHVEDGRCGLCGGIIFHGDPETGYQENGSVSLSPSYGWQIHT